MKKGIRQFNVVQIFYLIVFVCFLCYLFLDPDVTDSVPAQSLRIPPCFVPTWRYSKSKGRVSYGGFTADMGWVLMVNRYALSVGARLKFPNDWGHGPGGWTDMFVEPYDGFCSELVYIHNSDKDQRQRVKFKDFYDGSLDFKVHPNSGVQRFFGMSPDPNNDLITMRQLFKYTFQLSPSVIPGVTQEVNVLKLPVDYVGIHVRWGDKVGASVHASDPRESTYIPISVYTREIRAFDIRDVYIATDDYRAVEELRSNLGPDYTVHTRTDRKTRGFSITKYFDSLPRLGDSLDLWVDMEILGSAHTFVGNFESNVARMVHLMRDGRSINIMDTFRGHDQFSCCRHRYSNCFWVCT